VALSARFWAFALVAASLFRAWRTSKFIARWRRQPRRVGAGGSPSSAGSGPGLALLPLGFAAAGFIAVQPLFWTTPDNHPGGLRRQVVSLINALGVSAASSRQTSRPWRTQASVRARPALLRAR
jgi:hypothetical protein